MTKRDYLITHVYRIRCHITRRTSVTVEADGEEDAMNKFNSKDWIDVSPIGEVIDFTHDGRPEDIGPL